jgi:hypothetical protein
MRFLIAGVFAIAMIALAIGALRGRIQAKSCCTPVAPENDLRLRD